MESPHGLAYRVPPSLLQSPPKRSSSSPGIMSNARKIQLLSSLQWLFGITAFILAVSVTGGCNFIKFVATDKTSDGSEVALQFGIWRYQSWSLLATEGQLYVMETCHGYTDDVELDASWKAARAFSVLALLFVVLVMLLNLVAGCGSGPDRYQGILEAPLLFLTAIFQGLTLILLNSSLCKGNSMMEDLDGGAEDITVEDRCRISTGAKCIISATVLYFAAAVASLFEQRAEKEEREMIEAGLAEPLNHSLNV